MAPQNGYPAIVGDHKVSVFPHTGPTSYAAVTTGPLAGGDTVTVAEAGLASFDDVLGGTSDSGAYVVIGIPPVGNPSDDPRAAASRTWKLRWYTAANMVECGGGTDLDAETVRLFAIGRY